MPDALPGYWYSRLVFERALALIYLVAFLCAANQFVPLLGEHGLMPATRFVRYVPFRASPSLFFFASTDAAFRIAAWVGVALAIVAFSGVADRQSAILSAVVWFTLWALYLSFVNVGQTFYGFGWETLLLETGFFAISIGGRATLPSGWMIAIYRWLLFRVMFGAGLIKLRGDPCWRDLTCLDYYFETQPMPNPLSWYFHGMPASVHRAGVVFNHVAELGVPFAYFAPQPIAGIAGLGTIVFQLILILSGNLSWLNWLMWFAAFSTPEEHPWFTALLAKLLEGDRETLSLLRTNPFPDHPPRYVRAQYYEYHFTTREERRASGRWWNRQLVGTYFSPASLKASSR